jgi:putative tricarboxylic transport membrane protein
MRVPPIHAKVGPRVFPVIVSCGLALCGALLIWQARTKDGMADTRGDTDWFAVSVIAAGLIVHLNILKPAGFVPAGIALFLSVAFAFGSRRYLRDAIVAAITSMAAYLVFTRLLGLQLPPGILKDLL